MRKRKNTLAKPLFIMGNALLLLIMSLAGFSFSQNEKRSPFTHGVIVGISAKYCRLTVFKNCSFLKEQVYHFIKST